MLAVTTHDAVVGQPSVALPRKRIRWGEQFVHLILFIAAAISVLTTLGIVISLLLPAIEFFGEVSPWEFLTGTTWTPLFLDGQFGVVPLVVGTIMISFLSALVAFPLGLGVAIYLSEYANQRVAGVLKPVLEILAAIPTVVLGYFALTFVTPLLRDIGVQVEIFNALAASLVLGVMLIPTIASLSEDAMAAVPRDLRDGGYALGADKLQVSTRIVVPAAISGIIAAFVLGFSRAVGETMIVLIAAGQLAQITFDPRETIETMTAFIGATGNGDIPTGSIEYKTIFAVGLTLFVHDARHEPDLDQARAQVPRGVRVTVIEPHVERDFDPAPEQFGRRGQAWKNRLFKAAMLFSMFVAFGTLAVLLVDTIVTGWPAISWNLFSNPPSTVPAEAGARPAILATLYLGLLVLLLSVPIGVLTAIYLEEYADRTRWWNRLIEVNIQNLAAVPSIVYGILGLAFIVRGIGIGRVVLAGASSSRSSSCRRSSSPRARRSARSRTRSGKGHSRSARRSGRSCGGRCCLRRSRAWRPGRFSLCPGRWARPRRSSWSGRSRTSRSTRSCSAPIRRCRCRSTTGRNSPIRSSRRWPRPRRSCCS